MSHIHTHRNTWLHTNMFIRWLSHSGVHLDTEHLTLPEWLCHKNGHSRVPSPYITAPKVPGLSYFYQAGGDYRQTKYQETIKPSHTHSWTQEHRLRMHFIIAKKACYPNYWINISTDNEPIMNLSLLHLHFRHAFSSMSPVPACVYCAAKSSGLLNFG